MSDISITQTHMSIEKRGFKEWVNTSHFQNQVRSSESKWNLQTMSKIQFMTTNVILLNHGRGNEDLNVDVQQRG